jgi:hypothetical protein
MKQLIRPVLAYIAGIFSIFIILGIVEFIWLSLFTRPTETYQLKDMPIAALLIPLVGLLVATFVSGFISCYIAKSNPKRYVAAVGAITLIITGINQIGIPHPVWFSVLTFIFIPLTSVLIMRIYTAKNNSVVAK